MLDDAVATSCSADRDPRFDPPYTTVQANMISGGTAVNILARDATVTWEYRALPDRDASGDRRSGAPARRARDPAADIARARREASFETELHAAYPGLVLDETSPAIALAREISGANSVETVAYGTEAGHFQRAGIPAVICGPGSIEQAHKADEFVALAELKACEGFLRKLIARACV